MKLFKNHDKKKGCFYDLVVLSILLLVVFFLFFSLYLENLILTRIVFVLFIIVAIFYWLYFCGAWSKFEVPVNKKDQEKKD